MSKIKIPVLYLSALPLVLMLLSGVLAGCKKDSSTSTVGADVKLLINNLSADAYPVQLYVNNVPQNPVSNGATLANTTYTLYKYNQPSAYFSLKSSSYLPQLRATTTGQPILITVADTTKLLSGHKYSLFLTGLRADSSIRYILTADDTLSTAHLPALGTAKMRYVNTTLRTAVNGAVAGYDVYANGTKVFSNIRYRTDTPYKSISPYVQFPAGTYNLKFVYAGYDVNTSSNILINLTNVVLQDGHLYTLYSNGITGAGNDTAAVAAAIITNK